VPVPKYLESLKSQEEPEYLKNTGDFEQKDEVITLLIHNAAHSMKRRVSQKL
jgi:hypothetical protein